jgi:hypothetical protein
VSFVSRVRAFASVASLVARPRRARASRERVSNETQAISRGRYLATIARVATHLTRSALHSLGGTHAANEHMG